MALRPGINLAAVAIEDTLPLREPVVVSRAELRRGGGSASFEAWFELGGRDRLVGGLLLDLDRMLPSRPADEPSLAAYVSNCPHEACHVRLESDPGILARAANGASVPDGPVLFCPCHFSMFDLNKDGSRFAGPAYRGLYRFVLSERGGSIIIDRLEGAVVELFG